MSDDDAATAEQIAGLLNPATGGSTVPPPLQSPDLAVPSTGRDTGMGELLGGVPDDPVPPAEEPGLVDQLFGPAAAGPTGPLAGHFRVDPEMAEQLAVAIDIAAEDVQKLLARAEQLSSVRPGAADLVSLSAAGAMAGWPDRGDTTLVPALRAYFQELQASAAGYRRQLAEYRQADEHSAAGYRGIDPVEGP